MREGLELLEWALVLLELGHPGLGRWWLLKTPGSRLPEHVTRRLRVLRDPLLRLVTTWMLVS
jgi:hypothetical protein